MSTEGIDMDIETINSTIHFTSWTAWRMTKPSPKSKAPQDQLSKMITKSQKNGAIFRGAYDLRGFRGDADLLLWIHGSTADLVQDAIVSFSETSVGSRFETTWSGMGLHRPAEFNRSHVPAFMTGNKPKKWLCMYPFVRSYDWYLLPERERRDMLVEHGKAGSKYPGILSSTVASFALGDYEWLLALESDELFEIVDMMRDLRSTEARRHVREEVPFFTGRHIDATRIGEFF